MNQAQAIVAGVIRIISVAIILISFLLPITHYPSTYSLPSVTDNSGTQISETQMKALDFAAGTVVHVNWIGFLVPIFCILSCIFSRRLAVLITPKYKDD